MSEEQTERLNGENTFQARVLAEFAALDNRLTTELGAINGRLTSIENRLTSLEDRMTSLEDRMTSLEGRVTSLEGRVSAVDERLMALEEKVDSRLRETRPIWEGVLSQLKMIEAKLGVMAREWLAVRGEIDVLKEGAPPAA